MKKYFVFSGRKKVNLNLKLKNVKFFYKPSSRNCSVFSINRSLSDFFSKNSNLFASKKVGVVIPDATRDFHQRIVLGLLEKKLKAISRSVDFIIALGLHRKLNKQELVSFLGKNFLKHNTLFQHTLGRVKFIGLVNKVPVYLNKQIFSYDIIFTVGVVEPHLYAGFSGGVKCIAIGLAGKETILHTHAVGFLSQKKVEVGNIRDNPFHEVLWNIAKRLGIPIYSLNMVNNLKKGIAYYSIGEAGKSYKKTAEFARKIFFHKIEQKFDVLFVGCDFPKERSLYQTSRLFNYCLERGGLVKKGRSIFVFANLEGQHKSKAERNFEAILKKRIPANYAFKKPGEHRAFKVKEASKYARLGIITENASKYKYFSLTFLNNYKDALRSAQVLYGDNMKVGIIPSGFSFLF